MGEALPGARRAESFHGDEAMTVVRSRQIQGTPDPDAERGRLVSDADPRLSSPSSVSVLVVSQIRLYREGLVDLLEGQEDLRVLAAVANLEAAIPLVLEHRPDVVLLEMLGPERVSTIRWLTETSPRMLVVGLGIPHEESEIIACVEAGMVAYVPPEGTVADLVSEIHGAMRGEAACTPLVAGAAFRRLAVLARDRQPSRAEVLTVRESEVLLLMESGLSNKEIARRLSIELATVKNHVHNILSKLHLERRSQTFGVLRPDLSVWR
jgi:two-component system, NarL family, nitrate/nitrite response regulator NarL